MYLGNKVKLPEWTGYWFISQGFETRASNPADDIKAFLKNGDIGTDPVWIDKYKDRTDFEITEGNMGFDFAILSLKNGKKLARKSWKALKWVRRIDFSNDKEFSVIEHNPCEGTVMPTFAKLGITYELELGWRPSVADMMAEGWYVVN